MANLDTQTINFTDQDFESLSENVSRVKLSNMYTVQNPLSISGVSYIPRPTLTSFSAFTGKKVRGVWYQAQQGKTSIYVVADTTLYTLSNTGVATSVGTVLGTDFCTFASTIYHIGITGGGGLYLYDGTTLTSVTIPDAQTVTNVTSLDNYFVVGIQNTSRFYWVKPGAVSIDGLSFVSAERNPDDVVAVATVGDELWVIGQNTTEVFIDTGDQSAPFQRVNGRVYYSGCIDKYSVAVGTSLVGSSIYGGGGVLPCLIWVTSSKEVILSQGRPNKISNESIEELLKRATTYRGWTFRTNKHDFYVLNTDIATLVYDLTSGKWYRWNTYQKNYWDASFGVQVNDVVYVSSDYSGNVYKLTNKAVDNTQDYLVCEVSGFIQSQSENGTFCHRVTLSMNFGFASDYAATPVIEMRWSDDGGHTWTGYMQGQIGSRGSYGTVVSFRSLGSMVIPGRQIEIRFSEVQTFRFDGGVLNDKPGG